MTFKEVLAQVIDWLQQDKRITYHALKRQFDLDDDYLEDLKDELLFSHPVVDEDGRGLVWTGDTTPIEPATQRGADAESRFHTLLLAVMGLLPRERRVTYRTLKHILGVDDAMLADIRTELSLRRLAIEEDSAVLVWTGESQPTTQPEATISVQPPITEATTVTPAVTPDQTPAAMTADGQHDADIASEPVRPVPEAERRQLTVMFCDLADSTKLSQQLDPEDLREVVRAYQGTAAEVIQQYEGHMAQYLGDGLLIYFGWPVAHEDDAQRAAHAGLGIVEAITTGLNPRLEQEKGVQLTVRLGIHTGPVVVGEMGGGGRHENLAMGDTVNIAARLEGLASPNTVVISNVTARLIGGAFALYDLGPHELKGVTEPMPVFRVLGPMQDQDDETPTAGVPFLVGRDEEVGLLLRRWEQSKEGLGQVVLISGEAGIGKSSLVGGLSAHVVREGYRRIAFRCSSYHRNSALYPVITHVEHLLQFDREDTPATKLDKLEHGLHTSRFPLDDAVPLLASMLSVSLPEGRYPALTLTPQQQKQQTLDALVGWMLTEAEQQPVLVAWEDLHWADPSTLEMLGLILEQAPTVPMLSVLTFRPEFEQPWPTRSHMTPILLNRLERPQVETLITHLAGGKAMPAEVVQHIVGKTDGVPLYVEELTRMLLFSGLLREEADQYVLTGPMLSVTIPDTLQDSLMARLDRMQTAKEVAQLGAVLGREFSYEVLQAISPQDDQIVQASLAQLVEAELLYQRGRPPRSRYIFKHALVQDAAYASLLRSTQQQYHRRIAQILEERFPEIAETQLELLAHHYTEAGLDEQAIDYWHRAGQRACERSAYAEAINHFKAELALLTTLPDTPEHDQRELDVQVALGPALMATTGYTSPEVEQTYARAYELCQQLGETPQLFPVLWGLWQFHHGRAEIQKERNLGEELFSLAQRVQEPALLLQAHHALWTTSCTLGELTAARTHLEYGITFYDPQQHHSHASFYGGHDTGVCCRSHAAPTLWLLGYPDQALVRGHEALMLARELGHPFSLAHALQYTAMFHQYRREALAVQELAETVMTLSTEQGFAQRLAFGTVLRGWALAMQGQGETGLAEMHQGLTAFLGMGGRQMQPYILGLLAEAYEKIGRPETGLHELSEALDVMDATEARFYGAELFRLKGALLLKLATPDTSQAKACFHQALSIARHQQAKSLELRAATSLARLWQSRGKRQEAYDLLASVYEWFTEGFHTSDLKDAKALLAELE